jgi:hypothetical protein
MGLGAARRNGSQAPNPTSRTNGQELTPVPIPCSQREFPEIGRSSTPAAPSDRRSEDPGSGGKFTVFGRDRYGAGRCALVKVFRLYY